MIIYETDKFYLRPFLKSDITYDYLAWFHDQEVTSHTSHGIFPYTKRMALEFLENARKNNDIIWAIIAKEKCDISYADYSSKHIGNIALQNFNHINRTAEFAGIIGEKEYWGKGYGTKTVRLLFEHGFNKMNLHKIWLGTVITNKGMINIAEKLGMSLEGMLRHHVFLNERYWDVHQYGILNSEWNRK